MVKPTPLMRHFPPAARALAALLLVLLVAALAPARARSAPTPETAAASVDAALDSISTSVESLDPLAEARASFTPENREYQRIRVTLAFVSPLLTIAIGLAMLFTGLAQAFRDIAYAFARRRWARALIFFTLYSVTMAAVLLPLDWYSGWALEHRFRLSDQSLGDWGLDQLKLLGFQIAAVGVVPVLALAWHAVEASPRRWWLWLSLGAVPVLAASVLLQPLVFEPLFNKFTPLQDSSLRRDILALAARAHVPAHDVYEVDMSKRTKKVNAYVSGFGGSQRIVLWDTTLQQMSRDEILFVMGHEMGHYVLNHIWKGLVLTCLGSFAAFWLTAWFVRTLLARFGERWHVRSAGDLAALPLLLAMLGWVNFLGAPITNYVSRAIEHEADVFALELTHDNDAGARSFLVLAQDNRSDPEPARWVKWVLYSHPPLGERIRFALGYRPWERGEPNRAYREK